MHETISGEVYNRWYLPSGSSQIATYSDRSGVDDWGYGVALSFAPAGLGICLNRYLFDKEHLFFLYSCCYQIAI